MRKLLQGEDLRKKCEKLGVDLYGDPIHRSYSGKSKADDATLQSRLIAAEEHARQGKLWIIALISSIASVVSAIGAIAAAIIAYCAIRH